MPQSTLSAHDFPVDQKSIDQVCAQGIQNMDSVTEPTQHPRLAIIVGQPASGKSSTISRLQEKLQPKPFVIDSDKIRQWHPQIDEIFRRDPIRMDVLTNTIVAPVTERLLTHAQESRYNLVIENTLTNPESVQGTIDSFKRQGYHTMVIALAVPEQLSRIGIVNRYREAIAQKSGYPRWTTSLAHQNAYEAIPEGLKQLRNIDNVTVTDRSGATLYFGTDVKEAAVTIQTHRTKLWASTQAHEAFAHIYKQCKPLLGNSSFTQHESVAPLIRRINTTASELGLVQPQQPTSQYQAARALLDPITPAPNTKTTPTTTPNPASSQTPPCPPAARPGAGMGL